MEHLLVDLRLEKRKDEHEAERHCTGKLEERTRGAWMDDVHRKLKRTTAKVLSSGEQSVQPRGTNQSERRGE